ncbi:dicarboxylate/amino acid:cation symporter [uncultured Bifidobacterium sp.]|uniref:dicarboxylate/amino acid:cation symporter n=1 Tax=uncultured Bifidobacterium sp. TaxID=165187 RepID=UPI00258C8D7E|nr:dicarboxylate/amino acid:cation symporter [uncultured Bifidobacterium sp.]
MPSQFIDWAALAATVIAFAALWHLKRTRTAGFGLRVIIATALGIALGLIAQGHAQYVGVFGVIWSQVIAALVVPLLLFSVFSSVTNLGDSLRLRGMAVKTVVFLLLNTLTASLLTLGLASAFRIGVGFQFAMPTDYQQREVPGVIDTIINLFPSNLMANWSANQVVPVVLFSLLAAIAYTAVASTDSGRETVKPFKAVIDAGDAVLSKATQIIVGFTPYAVLSLIASAVGDNDILTLLPLLAVLGVAYLSMAIQMFVVQPLILTAATRLNPLRFFRMFWPAGMVAFTSESSIGTIPVTVRQLRSAGVPEDTAAFVAGLGANLGMPGCAGMWPTLLAVFAINAQGLDYTPWQYLMIVVLTLLVSIGTVGVPGTATITATSLFAAAGLPIPFIAIAQPISQIVDMGRTALNVAGAANTAVIVAASERQLDLDAYRGLAGATGGNADGRSPADPDQDDVDTAEASAAEPSAEGDAAPVAPIPAASGVPQLHLARAVEQDDEMCGIGLSGRR